MKNQKRWVIIDTETDGLYEPIHVVEISGQLMEGWQPVGQPFRMLLNHDVPIPPEAVSIHGYTREYLRAHGESPAKVHAAFRDYACDCPLVAHNLSFDWNRCLEPEWARLRMHLIGQRGFCSMMLARRLVSEITSYRLDVLKEHFNITQSRSHQAKNDVLTVVELFDKVYRPRLEAAGIDTFDGVALFSKKTPVAKCLDQVRCSCHPAKESLALKDQWYYIDAANNHHGPLSAREIAAQASLEVFYVWREGIPDWVVNRNSPEFLSLVHTPPPIQAQPRRLDSSKTMAELLGVCRGIIADNKVTTAEVMFLNSWLEDFHTTNEWPASEIAHILERILEDGVVSKQEKEELKILLQKITSQPQPTPSQAPHPETSSPITISLATNPSLPYTQVILDQGTQEWLEWRHQGIGASDAPTIMEENPWKSKIDLLFEKRGQPRAAARNSAMARGTQLEPEARKRYIASTGHLVEPACLQSNQYPWLRASVDGITPAGDVVVEIKCGKSAYGYASASGAPPDYYYGQLQHILAVTGLPSIDFWCYWPGYPEILITVSRDDDYIRRLLLAESAFWEAVKRE